jgi:ribosomal protein L6P/L9E
MEIVTQPLAVETEAGPRMGWSQKLRYKLTGYQIRIMKNPIALQLSSSSRVS